LSPLGMAGDVLVWHYRLTLDLALFRAMLEERG